MTDEDEKVWGPIADRLVRLNREADELNRQVRRVLKESRKL